MGDDTKITQKRTKLDTTHFTKWLIQTWIIGCVKWNSPKRFWIDFIWKCYPHFLWNISHFGQVGGAQVLDDPVFIPAKWPGGLWNSPGNDFEHFPQRNSKKKLWYDEIWPWPRMVSLWPGIPANIIFYWGFPWWQIPAVFTEFGASWVVVGT